MPIMNGTDSTREILEFVHTYDPSFSPKLPILGLSAYNDINTKIGCRKSGMIAYFDKPAKKNP